MTDDTILLGHGSGGRMSHELLEKTILPALGWDESDHESKVLEDAAVMHITADSLLAAELVSEGDSRIAMTTDSFVVSPIFFPGGDIGDLAVNGTVNDLVMMGAVPLYLTLGMVIEEGLLISELEAVLSSVKTAAEAAGVSVVAGDTKVVERGKADRLFLNTAGFGVVPSGRTLSAAALRPGDVIIISGTLGDHGIAVMSKREGIAFETPVVSDTASLAGLAAQLFMSEAELRALRDPTRGGLATTLCELATSSNVGIELDELAIPVKPEVARASDLLGLDPLYIANEGKMIVVVAPEDAERAIHALQGHPLGGDAAIIGTCSDDRPGRVTLRTTIGGTRVVDMLSGEQLPRIC